MREYLTQKRSVMQPAPRCQCERLISVALTSCNCITMSSVFDRIIDLKRRRTSRKLYSVNDLPAATSNIVSKGKQIAEIDSLGAEFTPSLKEVLIEPEGVYQHI